MNPKMILAIVVAVLSVLIASTAQLTDLFGAGVANTVVTIASMINSLLSSINAVLSTQSQTMKEVQSYPGVESVRVNSNANQTLAAMAVDPSNPKIGAASGAESAVKEIARGNG